MIAASAASWFLRSHTFNPGCSAELGRGIFSWSPAAAAVATALPALEFAVVDELDATDDHFASPAPTSALALALVLAFAFGTDFMELGDGLRRSRAGDDDGERLSRAGEGGFEFERGFFFGAPPVG